MGLGNAGRSNAPWIIDSGATHHMCYEREVFTSLKPLDVPKQIILGNGEIIQATHIGNIEVELKTGETASMGLLTNVLYTPDVTRNLFSVASCIQAGNQVTFSTNKAKIFNAQNELVAQGSLHDGLWSLETSSSGTAFIGKAKTGFDLWHQRFGHLGLENLKKVQGLVGGMEGVKLSEFTCDACVEGKQTKNSSTTLPKSSTRILEVVHSDVCGPIKPTSLGGNRYFVSFIDDFSRKSWVFLMKEKREVFSKFQQFKTMAETQSGEKLSTLRSDNGGEYTGKDFSEFCKDQGVIHVYSSPYSPNQNGVAERFNRTMIDMVTSMLSSSKLPLLL